MVSTRVAVSLLVAILTFVTAATAKQDTQWKKLAEMKMVDCFEEGDFECVKLKAYAFIYKLVKGKSMEVLDGLTLEYSGDAAEVLSARALADQSWGGLLGSIPKVINGLSLKLNILPAGKLVVSRSHKEDGLVDLSVESNRAAEGRGDEKRKGAMSLLLFGGLYSTLFILGLAATKFLAFKGLTVGAVALVLAVINGLSRLAKGNQIQQGYAYSRLDGYGGTQKSFADNVVFNSIDNNPQ